MAVTSIRRLLRRYRYFWLLILLIPAAVFAGWYVRGLFLLREFATERVLEGTTILADNGEVLTVLGQGPSYYIPLEDIPDERCHPAMEDRWFTSTGLQSIAILRALYVRAGKKVVGGSTVHSSWPRTCSHF